MHVLVLEERAHGRALFPVSLDGHRLFTCGDATILSGRGRATSVTIELTNVKIVIQPDPNEAQ